MTILRQTCAMLALCAGSVVNAADFHVKVIDRITGFPVENASVCLGTDINPSKFGGSRTNDDGIASFNAPVWTHQVQVSGNGYGNVNLTQPGRSYAFQLELRVDPGRAEPVCRVEPVNVAPRAGISITDINVLTSDVDSGRLEIKTRTRGFEPTHVRVASRADFAGSSWQAMSEGRSVHYVRNMQAGLFVQVRRRIGTETQYIESVSDVVNQAL